MNNKPFESQQAADFISEMWDTHALPALLEYTKIPNKSVFFDPEWEQHGFMNKAMSLLVEWCETHSLEGMKLDLLTAPGRSPLLFIDVPSHGIDETVLLYGHMDKQPEMTGWDSNKGPWSPLIENGKLYGRGAADDGYSVFAAMTAIKTLQHYKIPHARCIIFIEASEESGSIDLPFYLEQLNEKMGTPSLIICLDSGAGNFEQLWGTTSLRGVIGGDLEIETLNEGIHSGMGSGVVPSVFGVFNQLLSRIENPTTQQIELSKLYVDIPEERIKQAQAAANILKQDFLKSYDFAGDTQPINKDICELILSRTWHPALSITGLEGVPAMADAGNVTLPSLKAKLSLRIPPTLSPQIAQDTLKTALENDPPFGARVHYIPHESVEGWNAPALAPWLKEANDAASKAFFKKPAAYFGEGGSIPFMGMLGRMFPEAQFMITGVLGPGSNAHGPNEFLEISYVKQLTGCIAYLLAAHYTSKK